MYIEQNDVARKQTIAINKGRLEEIEVDKVFF